MVLELAHIDIKQGTDDDFLAAMAMARALLQRAKGYHGMQLRKVMERSSSYQLLVQWRNLEDHIGFQASADFQEWRRLLGLFFTETPRVEHSMVLLEDEWPLKT